MNTLHWNDLTAEEQGKATETYELMRIVAAETEDDDVEVDTSEVETCTFIRHPDGYVSVNEPR